MHACMHGCMTSASYAHTKINDREKTNGGTDEQTDTPDRITRPATSVGYGQLKRDNDHSPPAITSRTSLRSAINKNRFQDIKQRNDVLVYSSRNAPITVQNHANSVYKLQFLHLYLLFYYQF